ncbi:helix-turn-helix domain-containing protein [Flavobacterium tyrosinilyticum]|uniref:helix-turn-helix domain-containing protein n=1 Tax=Flavobacterium tyrosinilyticum TaxID=1658740 RepID=UPI00202EA273|nr:helix-turn-helix domain-containing protein [Flavobacterium tyrosinilyticum]MCM0666830.1 helix-turn-helix domain-containing protein [Flavobacterium tyrosinilyticum]
MITKTAVLKNKILTYSLTHHKSLFSYADQKEYFYIQTSEHPYITEPYRAESYAIEFLRKGSIVMHTGLETKVVHAPAVIALGPSVIRSFSKNEDEILIDIIFFKPQFFLENQANVFFLTQYDFFENSDSNTYPITKIDESKFERIFSLIKEVSEDQSKHQASILRSYLYILIYEIDGIQKEKIATEVQNPLYEKFKELLFKDFLNFRSVQHYADELNVSRKYLSEVIKKHSGKTASDWISEMVILEAKVLLQNKKMSINQISDLLHFSDQSVFGRFFKNYEGISPLEYRKKQID